MTCDIRGEITQQRDRPGLVVSERIVGGLEANRIRSNRQGQELASRNWDTGHLHNRIWCLPAPLQS